MKVPARWSAIDDSEPLPVSLLRAPAAIAAGAFVAGVAVGAVAAPFASAPTPAITYLLTLIVCAPFLLPTSAYRRHRALWWWMAAAAALATMRAVFMAGFLLPYQSWGAWALKCAMDLLAAAVLWLATLAIFRAPVPDS
ncbi:MAG TPA: hypothetical protein VFK57_14285 [Vicinamibacterales bacterium]|nr:hypothetical protein [Vicinamibacterales bacterium]